MRFRTMARLDHYHAKFAVRADPRQRSVAGRVVGLKQYPNLWRNPHSFVGLVSKMQWTNPSNNGVPAVSTTNSRWPRPASGLSASGRRIRKMRKATSDLATGPLMSMDTGICTREAIAAWKGVERGKSASARGFLLPDAWHARYRQSPWLSCGSSDPENPGRNGQMQRWTPPRQVSSTA